MTGYNYDEATRVPVINGLYNRLGHSNKFFQTVLNLNPASRSPHKMGSAGNRTIGYDTYVSTRTMAPVSSQYAPPQSVGYKPFGTEFATVYRMHPKIEFYDEEILGHRNMGSYGPTTSIDEMGMNRIAFQVDHVRTGIDNSVEYMVAKMLTEGGYALRKDGEELRLCSLSDARAHAALKNEYRIPDENKTDVDGILAGNWHDPAAKVFEEVMAIAGRQPRFSGLPIRHIFLNGFTALPLFNNTTLKGIAGTSNTLIARMADRNLISGEQATSTSYDLEFKALPGIVFHIYNEGYVEEEISNTEENVTSTTYWKPYIPTGKAIMVPDAGSWASWMGYQEPIAENVMDSGRMSGNGINMWRTRSIDPPRYDFKFLLNYVPILPIPRAVIIADVLDPANLDYDYDGAV